MAVKKDRRFYFKWVWYALLVECVVLVVVKCTLVLIVEGAFASIGEEKGEESFSKKQNNAYKQAGLNGVTLMVSDILLCGAELAVAFFLVWALAKARHYMVLPAALSLVGVDALGNIVLILSINAYIKDAGAGGETASVALVSLDFILLAAILATTYFYHRFAPSSGRRKGTAAAAARPKSPPRRRIVRKARPKKDDSGAAEAAWW